MRWDDVSRIARWWKEWKDRAEFFDGEVLAGVVRGVVDVVRGGAMEWIERGEVVDPFGHGAGENRR